MIAIYEPLYVTGQQLTEPCFRPLVVQHADHPEWREFRILVDMFRRGLHRQQAFTGLMSPKFGIKTGVTGLECIDFVRANSDADVCFINPFPQLAYISFNVWMQGEVSHPGLVERAQDLLDAGGIDLKLKDVPRQGHSTLCYCNFWVGSERFWEAYVGGLLIPIAEFLEQNPDHPASRAVLMETQHTDPAPFLPFIVERLFSSFLSRQQGTIVARAYPMDPLTLSLQEFDRQVVTYLKEKIDSADRADHFPDSTREELALLCKLWQVYNAAYYEHRPHPHSGHIIRLR